MWIRKRISKTFVKKDEVTDIEDKRLEMYLSEKEAVKTEYLEKEEESND